jgi:hypothetical protein
MEKKARTRISERWGRFVRWFLIASPTGVGPPKPPLQTNASSRPQDGARDE